MDIFQLLIAALKSTPKLIGSQQHPFCGSAGQSRLVRGCSYWGLSCGRSPLAAGAGIQDGLVTCLVPLWGQLGAELGWDTGVAGPFLLREVPGPPHTVSPGR